MHLLRFDDAQTGAPLGSIAWFPVHGTSLKVSNRYVSGDNKGIASQLMERHFNGGRDWPPAGGARGTFVAAFPQSHSGDVSPNVRGVFRVPDADGAAGEGDEVEEVRCNSSVFKLHQSATTELPKSLTLSVVHDTRDVSEERFPAVLDLLNSVNNSASYRKDLRACKAAIGYAFCAGTADGKALFSYFTSGTQRASVLVDAIRDLLAKVTPEDAECQGSKRICLNVGKIFWSGIPFMSSQIPTQLLRIGPIFILALPTEVTTMAGRKINGKLETAGATLFGPHTLNFYAWHASRMLRSIINDKTTKEFRKFPTKTDATEFPAAAAATAKELTVWTLLDLVKNFGQQLLNLRNSYEQGDTVELKFVACNPRHSFGISNHSFLLVQRYNTRLHRWETVRNDASLDT
uniref:Neutral ceramidase n=1 Tax=Macrostomum lignano TaxID=282301 RepID=A0A1I8IXK6_9PLAT